MPDTFSVTFWGVRGSLPTPGPETVEFGGNTACIEVRCGSRLLVFDAGTGLRQLGDALMAKGDQELDLFLSHGHYDHVIGLPFFQPLYRPESRVRLWSGPLAGQPSTRSLVEALMRPPFFPMEPSSFNARVDYRDVTPDGELDLGDGIVISFARLKHPDGCLGFRVAFGGRAFCYVADTEHVPGAPDPEVLALIERADLVVYDSSFTDEEFPGFVGFGHSTWQEGARLCERAGAGRLVIFHHAPSRADCDLRAIAVAAERTRPGSIVAREGLRVEL
jgi:phosphoribosyl 1,2-cyclic phosphodiesterase